MSNPRIPKSAPPDPAPGQLFATAEAVRAACLDAARQAYEDAGFSGLCAEGRHEAVLSNIASLDLTQLLSTQATGPGFAAAQNLAGALPNAESG